MEIGIRFTDVRGSQPPLADASAATHATQCCRSRGRSESALALESAGEEAVEVECACIDAECMRQEIVL